MHEIALAGLPVCCTKRKRSRTSPTASKECLSKRSVNRESNATIACQPRRGMSLEAVTSPPAISIISRGRTIRSIRAVPVEPNRPYRIRRRSATLQLPRVSIGTAEHRSRSSQVTRWHAGREVEQAAAARERSTNYHPWATASRGEDPYESEDRKIPPSLRVR